MFHAGIEVNACLLKEPCYHTGSLRVVHRVKAATDQNGPWITMGLVGDYFVSRSSSRAPRA